MTEFKTQVDLDISLEDLENHDVETKKVNLYWNLELEMRQYGVKSFIITVPDQKLNISLNMWGEAEDFGKEITLDVEDVLIEHDGEFFSSIIPKTLEYYKGKWKLVF